MEQDIIKLAIEPGSLFSAMWEELEKGREASFTVTGMSMWPFICHGRDHVIVEACDPARLKKGDIILFQTPLANYMLHRITGLRAHSFETTGDGNCFRDGWFPRDCVKAKVISIERKGKSINCNSLWWRFVFFLWMALFPIRSTLLCVIRRIGRYKAKIPKCRIIKQ